MMRITTQIQALRQKCLESIGKNLRVLSGMYVSALSGGDLIFNKDIPELGFITRINENGFYYRNDELTLLSELRVEELGELAVALEDAYERSLRLPGEFKDVLKARKEALEVL